MARSSVRLGKVQLQIMQILWRDGEATARQITEELSGASSIAHSTVQTLLRKMEEKGAVAHTQDDRTFIYRPLYREAEVRTTATHDLLSRVFNGSVYGLVSHLISNESVPAEELARLRELIDEAARKEGQK